MSVKIVAVTSGKGGTGKSCVAAYTGIALAKQGQKTLLVELGASFRSLDLILGLQEQAVFDAGDLLTGGCEIEKAVLASERYGNLSLIPAGLSPAGAQHRERLEQLLQRIERRYDFVLLDGVDFSVLSPARTDTILQVLTPDSLCIRACAHQARELMDAGGRLRLVINNVPARVLPMMGANDFDDVIDLVGVQLIAVIPTSPKLQYSSNNAQPLDEESITVKVFENLAGRLLGRNIPLLIR